MWSSLPLPFGLRVGAELLNHIQTLFRPPSTCVLSDAMTTCDQISILCSVCKLKLKPLAFAQTKCIVVLIVGYSDALPVASLLECKKRKLKIIQTGSILLHLPGNLPDVLVI